MYIFSLVYWFTGNDQANEKTPTSTLANIKGFPGTNGLVSDGMNAFEMNKATDSGGGIYMSKTNSGMNTFIDNLAKEGGGIYAKASSTVKLSLME